MRITAGLGCADDFDAYADAGADEVFCGYVPEEWMRRYGMALPLNRREVRYYGVQLGAEREVRTLAEKAQRRGVNVAVTLNALHYIPEQYPLLAEIAAQCAQWGVGSLIVADMALLVYLHTQGLDRAFQLHVSGEIGECSRGTVSLCAAMGAKRMIFHRKTSVADMASVIRAARERAPGMTFEAFALNELCHFSGALCASLHCDELAHMCRVPYRLSGGGAPVMRAAEPDASSLGAGGCGLCALWDMRQAGVEMLKVVGRGNHAQAMVRDIRAVKQAALTAEASPDAAAYRRAMRRLLYPNGCPRRCYYPELTST